jgi:hypothetical protein
MAITTTWNYTAAAATKQPTIPDVDFSTFTELNRGPKSDFWMTNGTSPLDSPETVRTKIQNIGNIYDGTQILPSYFATSKAGRSIFIQLNDILTATDSADSTYRVDLPFSGHVELKFPTHALITGDMLLAFYERLMSMAFATGVVTKSRLEALMRGTTKPTNLG